MAVSRNLGLKVAVVDDILSSHEQEIYSTISFDEKCIEFEFQKDRNYYVDLRQTYMAFKLKIIKGCRYKTYNSKEDHKDHKDHKEKTSVDVETEGEQEVPFPFVTDEKTFCKQFFPLLKRTSKISKYTFQMGCMGRSLTFRTTSRWLCFLQGSFALRGVRLRRICWWNYRSTFVWTFFPKENENA